VDGRAVVHSRKLAAVNLTSTDLVHARTGKKPFFGVLAACQGECMHHQGSTARRVLVVGGGIAGFAMIRALDQRGIPAVLVDRLNRPPDVGLGLNLPGNAVRALRELGVGEELKARGVAVRRREYRNARNRLLFAIDEAGFWGTDAGSICALRGDVLELLRSGVSASAVRWGTTVSAVSERGQQVEVSFPGTDAESYDFVVGADGVHSAIRTSVVGTGGRRTALLSAAGWRFMTTNPGVECWSSWTGPAETFLLIPVDGERVYGYASPTKGRPVDTDRQWLRSTFGDYPEPVRSAVSSVLAEPSSLYHSPIEEIRLDSWHRSRVVLIGDAAHATAPVWAQGAAMAAEDALVLAELLATRDDWAAVGGEFERRRRPRVEHVQKMTDRLSRTAGLPGWLRDAIVPVLGPRTYRETFAPLREPVVASRHDGTSATP
jgi:2-polyprenyl-6-methoxyphenol hydroxylase-like FAD-dependent oxidoreductase